MSGSGYSLCAAAGLFGFGKSLSSGIQRANRAGPCVAGYQPQSDGVVVQIERRRNLQPFPLGSSISVL